MDDLQQTNANEIPKRVKTIPSRKAEFNESFEFQNHWWYWDNREDP